MESINPQSTEANTTTCPECPKAKEALERLKAILNQLTLEEPKP